MKKNLTLIAVLLLTLLGWNASVVAATTVDIPVATTINWENATLENCKSENGGTDVGSTRSNTVITFNDQQYCGSGIYPIVSHRNEKRS